MKFRDLLETSKNAILFEVLTGGNLNSFRSQISKILNSEVKVFFDRIEFTSKESEKKIKDKISDFLENSEFAMLKVNTIKEENSVYSITFEKVELKNNSKEVIKLLKKQSSEVLLDVYKLIKNKSIKNKGKLVLDDIFTESELKLIESEILSSFRRILKIKCKVSFKNNEIIIEFKSNEDGLEETVKGFIEATLYTHEFDFINLDKTSLSQVKGNCKFIASFNDVNKKQIIRFISEKLKNSSQKLLDNVLKMLK